MESTSSLYSPSYSSLCVARMASQVHFWKNKKLPSPPLSLFYRISTCVLTLPTPTTDMFLICFNIQEIKLLPYLWKIWRFGRWKLLSTLLGVPIFSQVYLSSLPLLSTEPDKFRFAFLLEKKSCRKIFEINILFFFFLWILISVFKKKKKSPSVLIMSLNFYFDESCRECRGGGPFFF